MSQAMIEFAPVRTGKIHAAKLENSPRLQRMLALLQDGQKHSTRDIVMNAHIMAVNSAAAELRMNGINVCCEAIGKGRYVYCLGNGRKP